MLQDLRHAVRLLRTHPGFSLVAILTFALGIGATTTLFTVVDALLHPVPYESPEQLVSVEHRIIEPDGSEEVSSSALTAEQARQWKTATGIFSYLSPRVFGGRMYLLDQAGPAARLDLVNAVGEDYFPMLGVRPVLGRLFGPADTAPDAPLVAVLSDELWQERYGRDPGVVGQTLRFSSGPATIVGVLPPRRDFGVQVWLSRPDEAPSIGIVMARLEPGLSMAEAQQRLEAVYPALVEAGLAREGLVRLEPAFPDPQLLGGRPLRSLTIAALAILLLACVNVTGLLVARNVARRPEVAVRLALGAPPGRLVRLLVIEVGVLAALGALAGIPLASAAIGVTVNRIAGLVAWSEPALGIEVLVACAVLTAIVAGVVGGVPAWRVVRKAGHTPRPDAAGPSLTGRAGGGRLVMAIETALVVALLGVSGLLARNVGQLASLELGTDISTLHVVNVEPVEAEPGELRDYFRRLLTSVRDLPDVEAAGISFRFSLDGVGMFHRVPSTAGVTELVMRRQVSVGYLEALALPIRQGRVFTPAEGATGAPSVVLNEEGARRLFPDTSAVGQHLVLARQSRQVVGVVADARLEHLARPRQAVIYELLPDADPPGQSTLLIRSRGLPPELPSRLRDLAIAQPLPVVVDIDRVSDLFWRDRYVADRFGYLALFGVFTVLGVLLAAVGIFGVTAYAVARRTREIGVRLALGSSPARAVREMLRETAVPMGVGIVAGLGGAALASKAIAHLLVGISPHDPLTYALVGVTFAAVAMLAAWLPARRAGRVDPVIALRAE